MKKKAAILGYGFWGRIMEKYVEVSSDFELVKIFSRNILHPKGTTEINEILASEIQIVFISLPPKFLYSFTKLCLENGKHVFCEKPLSTDPKEILELFSLAKTNNLKLFTNYTFTHSPSIKLLKEKIVDFSHITEMEFSISQYGKFYEELNSFDIIGCHFLAIYFYLFEDIDPSTLAFKLIDNNPENKNLNLTLELKSEKCTSLFKANLLDNIKHRSIRIKCEKNEIVFNPLLKNTLTSYRIDKSNKIIENEFYSFDESNNLFETLRWFNSELNDGKDNTETIPYKVSYLLNKIRAYASNR